MQEDWEDKVACDGHSIEKECTLHQLEEELNNLEKSVKLLNANLNEQNEREVKVLHEMQELQERISKQGVNTSIQRLLSLLKLLKAQEREESDIRSHLEAKHSKLKAEIFDLGEKVTRGNGSNSISDWLDQSIDNSLEELNAAKRELTGRLRAILLLKRQLDEIPLQTELIQYERRFSELYVQIQEKLRRTRQFYATYNALVEIKELMLKETSLLSSINSQFQDAITSTAGRLKLIDSMEGIVKGTQQKLEKVELGLQAEQKVCDALKERHTAAIAEQRSCYSLLKAFQEECTKNERLRRQTSM